VTQAIVKRRYGYSECFERADRITPNEVVHTFGRPPEARPMPSREALGQWFELAAVCAKHIRLGI
jgi:hypothetical protein